jgi:hypothetical protein
MGKINNQSIKFFIFYHDSTKLAQVTQGLDSNFFKLVDLNTLTLPESFIIQGLSENENKALYAEYFGIMSIKPKSEMVGCLTYSIPLKFSVEWALETGCTNLFLPEIKFKDLQNTFFDIDKIYAPEFKNPCDKFENYVLDLHNRFPTGRLINKGPFKGSFIVNRDIFQKAQKWLVKVTEYVAMTYDFRSIACDSSIFGNSVVAQRDEYHKKLDKLRHTYGNILERGLAYFLGNAYPDNKKVWLGEYLMNQKIENDDILQKAHKYKQRNTIIVAISSNQYSDVALSWAKSMQDLNITNYLIIAMEEELHAKLKDNNINVAYKPFVVDKDLGSFWVFRLKVIKSLLDSGVNVIHSDTDALWLKNPLHKYFYDSKFDVLASQGTIWPHDIVEKWGFVLCCGLIYYKSSPSNLLFFKELIKKSIEVKEDQTALNRILFEEGINWDYDKEDYILTHNNRKFKCFNKIVSGKCRDLLFGLLPHHLFQRFCEPDKSPYVAHLLSEKNANSKLNAIEIIRSRYPKKPKTKESNLVWLASYPRSGNTLLRIILNHNFGLKSYSIYNDPNDIGKIPEVAEVVGHINMDWSFLEKHTSEITSEDYKKFDHLRYSTQTDKPLLIKTHSPWHQGFAPDRAIYIYRDGRSALRSHASYTASFTKIKKNAEELLESLLCCGNILPSTWNNHILTWNNHPKNKLLLLKFEEVIADFQTTFDRISDFLDINIVSRDVVTFQQLNKINSDFFRKGKKKSWHDMFNPKRNALFWSLNFEAMNKFGYDSEKSPLCDLLPPSSCPTVNTATTQWLNEESLVMLASLLNDVSTLIANNLHQTPKQNKKVVANLITDAYAHFSVSFSLFAGNKNFCNWKSHWDSLYEHSYLKDYKRFWPYIYIATPSFNSVTYIDKAIHSVITQEGNFFIRYHVQDAGSTDGTLARLQYWKDKIDKGKFDRFCKGVVFTYESSQDKGMYDALNKAFEYMDIPAQAIMSWINSDDVYLQGAFAYIFHSMRQLTQTDWIIGKSRTFGEDGELRAIGNLVFAQKIIASGLCDGNNCRDIQQEGVFFRKRLWQDAGGLNPNLENAGDWDLWRKFACLCNPVYSPHPLAMFRKRVGQLGEDVRKRLEEINEVLQEEKSDQLDKILLTEDRTVNYLVVNPQEYSFDIIKNHNISKFKIEKRKYQLTPELEETLSTRIEYFSLKHSNVCDNMQLNKSIDNTKNTSSQKGSFNKIDSSIDCISNKTKLLFVHIPKCAGQTVMNVIRTNILKDKMVLYGGNEKQKIHFESITDLSPYHFIGGHYSYPFLKERIGDKFINNFYIFTILRNPIDRAVSLYNYIKRTPDHTKYELIQKMSFKDFIQSDEYDGNQQCYMLCEQNCFKSAIQILLNEFDNFVTINNTNKLINSIFNHYNKKLSFYQNKNTSKNKQGTIIDDVLDTIYSKDKEDFALYSYVKKLEKDSFYHKSSIPKFYILTPSLNNADTIEKTIHSIISQTGTFELHYHVLDRGSTDGTVDLLRMLDSKVKNKEIQVYGKNIHFSWYTTTSCDIYGSIRKGFDNMFIASHDFMAWINPGDILLPGALNTLVGLIQSHPDIQWFGKQSIESASGHHMPTLSKINLRSRCDEDHLSMLQRGGTFFKKAFWFNEKYTFDCNKMASGRTLC